MKISILLILLLSSCTLKYNTFSCAPEADGAGSCVINFELIEHEDDNKPKLQEKE